MTRSRPIHAGLLLVGMLAAGCGQNANQTGGFGGSAVSTGGSAFSGGAAGAVVTFTGSGGFAGTKADASGAGGQSAGGGAGPSRDAASDLGQTAGSAGQGGAAGAGGRTGGAGGAGAMGGAPGRGGTGVVGGSGAPSDASADGRGSDLTVVPAKDAALGTDAGERVVTFKNGVSWNDSKGKRIEAHGGGFLKVSDTWYWFGEDKSQDSGTFKAVNCYASKDLVAWEFRNAIITRSTATQLNTADRIIERPKVIYNDSTKQYVMWAHWDNGDYSEASAGVFTSPTVDGNYTFVRSFKPLGNMSRDCNLFKDDDGKAYFMSSANENADMMLYLLTDDYLDVKQLTIKLWAGSKREAPAMYKIGTTYYMITSACTGWDPNQAQYATATAVAGPWTSLTNIGDSTTFDTQSTYVIPVEGSETTTYLYAGDRWKDPNLVDSKYIWLPLIVKGAKLGMDNHSAWSLNLSTGRWSAGNSNYVSQDGWKLLKADSEETQKESAPATDAFDGLSSTFWHSKYTGGTDSLPHELEIDLGATYNLTGMSYLPRQDGNDNGLVGQYEFYVSTDFANWGTAVKTGTFASDHTEQVVSFPSKTARYIRFRALSEIQGKQYTAVAEVNVVGSAQ